MTKTELIKKIAGQNNIPGSEEKLFFEILLKRCSEILNSGESLNTAFGKLIYRKAIDEPENESIIFITNENEELLFDIPQKEEDNFSIDSYFSISLGKPIIPLQDSNVGDFFIPKSDDEMKRMLELKVEKFIDEASDKEFESEEEKYNDEISDIRFSFLNWKKTSDLNEDLADKNNVEKQLTDHLSPDVENKTEEKKDNEQKTTQEFKSNQIKDEANKEIDETTSEVTAEETEEVLEEWTDKKISEPEVNEETDEELISEDLEDQEDLMEVTDEWVDDLIDEQENSEKEIPKEITKIPFFSEKKDEEPVSDSSEKEKSGDVNNAFVADGLKNDEDKVTKTGNNKSYIRFVYAAAVIIIVSAVIYYSFFSSGNESITSVQETAVVGNFNVVIERSFDNPVTYPYEKGMFTGTYNAISSEVLNQPASKADQKTENVSAGNDVSRTPDIREPLPAKRIKGYIYQYEDGMIAVQVSSWKSRSIALSETQKFLDSGYDAFVEQTEITSGTYYRVRIGGFKSLAEAEEFLRK
jgi:hypothetical protein